MKFNQLAAAAVAVSTFIRGSLGQSSMASIPSGAASTTVAAGGTTTAMTLMTSPAPITSAAAVATNSSGMSTNSSDDYTCAQGDFAFYLITQEFTGLSLNTSIAYFSNWTNAVSGMLVNSNGESAVGANRTFTSDNITIGEVLIYTDTSPVNGSLHQRWNSTIPLDIDGLMLYTYTDDLTVYFNTTSNQTDVQLSFEFCTNNQTVGLQLASAFLQGEVEGWYMNLGGSSNGTAAAAPMSTGSSTMASSLVSDVATAPGSGTLTVTSLTNQPTRMVRRGRAKW